MSAYCHGFPTDRLWVTSPHPDGAWETTIGCLWAVLSWMAGPPAARPDEGDV